MAQLAFAFATIVVTEKEIILKKRQVRLAVTDDDADELAHFGDPSSQPVFSSRGVFINTEQGDKDLIDLWQQAR